MNNTHEDRLPLINKIGLYFLGNFSTKIIGTLLIPLYAIYVKPAELGEIDLQQNIASIVAPIIVIGVWEAILKFGISEDYIGKKRVLNTTFFYSMFSSIISFFVILPVYLNNGSGYKLSLCYSLLIVTTPISSIFQYYTRMYQKNKLFVKSSVTASIFRFCLLIITIVLFDLGIFGLIISLLGSQIFLVIYLWFGLDMKNIIDKEYYDSQLLKKMLIFSFPLAINLVSLWFLSGFTRLYINFEHGSDANGIYTFGLQCASLVLMIGQVVNMATLEETLSSDKKKFPSQFENYTDNLINIFFDFSTIMIPVISIFFILISKSSFSESFVYVPILMLNAIIISIASNMNNVFQFQGNTRFVFFSTLISAAVNILSAVFLNKFLGVQGIVIAQLIGSLTLFLIRYYFVKKDIGYHLKKNQLILSIILFLISSYFSLYLKHTISLICIVFLTLILGIKNKKVIIFYLKKIQYKKEI